MLSYSLVRCVALQSYVNCALGVHRVGFVVVAYGAVSAVTSLALGHVTDTHIRRVYVVVSGAAFNAGLLLTLAWWTPSADDPAMFYVVAGCIGLCDAIWPTQTNSKLSSVVLTSVVDVNKSSAVAEMGDRLATIDTGQK